MKEDLKHTRFPKFLEQLAFIPITLVFPEPRLYKR